MDERGTHTSEEVTRELVKRYQGGDRKAGNQLLITWDDLIMSFVRATVRQKSHKQKSAFGGIAVGDLLTSAQLGLLQAAAKFDLARGTKFQTYAWWWVRQAMTRVVANDSRTVRVPVHTQELVAAFRGLTDDFIEFFQRPPEDDEELASFFEIPLEVIERIHKLSHKEMARSIPLVEDPEDEESHPERAAWAVLGDAHVNDLSEPAHMTTVPRPDSRVDANKQLETVSRILIEAGLDEREETVIRLRFMHMGGGTTLMDVGGMIPRKSKINPNKPLSRERIRQIQRRALKKLRDQCAREKRPIDEALWQALAADNDLGESAAEEKKAAQKEKKEAVKLRNTFGKIRLEARIKHYRVNGVEHRILSLSHGLGGEPRHSAVQAAQLLSMPLSEFEVAYRKAMAHIRLGHLLGRAVLSERGRAIQRAIHTDVNGKPGAWDTRKLPVPLELVLSVVAQQHRVPRNTLLDGAHDERVLYARDLAVAATVRIAGLPADSVAKYFAGFTARGVQEHCLRMEWECANNATTNRDWEHIADEFKRSRTQ